MILTQASVVLTYLLFIDGLLIIVNCFFINFALLQLLSQFLVFQDAQIGQSK